MRDVGRLGADAVSSALFGVRPPRTLPHRYPSVIQNDTDGKCHVPANDGASSSTCGDHNQKCLWANDLCVGTP